MFAGALAAALAAVSCAGPGAPGHGAWPQWRGPSGQGVSGDADLPVTWSAESPNVKWSTEVPGIGNSSPIVSNGRVFLTSAYSSSVEGKKKRRQVHFLVIGLDVATGELLWETEVTTGRKPKKHWLNTFAAPTPVTDGEKVFVYFGETLAALDVEGSLLWTKNVYPDFVRFSHYGAVSSPILTDRGVVVMHDREEADEEKTGWIALFDPETGDEIWRDEWGETCCSYTTPLLLERDGRLEIVNSSARRVVANDAETGERLWTAEHHSLQPVPSLVVHGNLLIAPGGVHERATTVLRLSGTGKGTQTEKVWESSKGAPKLPSPLVYQNRLVRVNDDGILTVVEPETGKMLWQKRLEPGTYSPSLVAGDGKVYATNTDGVTTVIQLEPEYEILAENHLGDGSDSSPAIGEGCFLIRSKTRLYCIEKEAAAGRDRGPSSTPSSR